MAKRDGVVLHNELSDQIKQQFAGPRIPWKRHVAVGRECDTSVEILFENNWSWVESQCE